MDERSLLEQARAADPDRSLCALFAPPRIRAEILGLILLDHELARVPLIVTQPLAGMIRFQWWRDALASLTQDGPLSVLALAALAPAVRRGAIALDDLGALIDAREHDLDEVPPADLAALEIYLASTAGRLWAMAAACLGSDASIAAVARLLGTAHGLVRIVRAVRHERGHERSRLPASLLGQHGIEPNEILDRAAQQRLDDVTDQLLTRAQALLTESRYAVGRPPHEQMAPFLLSRITSAHLRQLRRGRGQSAVAPTGLVPLTLLWAWATRRV